MFGSSSDGDDHVQTSLSVLDRSPEVVTHLPGQLSQIDLHATHPVVLPTNVVVEQSDVDEVVQLLVPVEIEGLPPLGVESVVQDLGLDFLLAQRYLNDWLLQRCTPD